MSQVVAPDSGRGEKCFLEHGDLPAVIIRNPPGLDMNTKRVCLFRLFIFNDLYANVSYGWLS